MSVEIDFDDGRIERMFGSVELLLNTTYVIEQRVALVALIVRGSHFDIATVSLGHAPSVHVREHESVPLGVVVIGLDVELSYLVVRAHSSEPLHLCSTCGLVTERTSTTCGSVMHSFQECLGHRSHRSRITWPSDTPRRSASLRSRS